MASERTISIARTSRDGPPRGGRSPVSVPVGELMASNGLVTGQSGANPDESVRRVAASLLEADETLVVVDPTGSYESLTTHATVLHVGGDRDCDVQVSSASVDRVASLALDGATSVVLDLSAFEANSADDVLGGLTDELLDRRREHHEDLLLVVGECHRWLAANGPATRSGENLVALGGRRHDGVGIVGVTDQPADLRDDVITGVDWVLAHRLTWREDVSALERLLDRQYAESLEDLADDEAFFNAGWEPGVERIRLGDDSGRSDPTGGASETAEGLLADLPAARSPDDANVDGTAEDDAVEAIQDDLAEIERRLGSLEAKLDAREDVETMADRIAEAITDGLTGAEVGRLAGADRPGEGDADAADRRDRTRSTTERQRGEDTDEASGGSDGDAGGLDAGGFGDVFGAFDDAGGPTAGDTASTDESTTADEGGDDGLPADVDVSILDEGTGSSPDPDPTAAGGSDDGSGDHGKDGSGSGDDGGGMSFKPIDFGFDEPGQDLDSTVPDDFGPPSRRASSGRSIPRYLRKIVRDIEEMDDTTRRMLAYYVEEGTDAPIDAHFSAGGGGDRTRAYAHNRRLRTAGYIEHVGKGQYAPRLREYVIDRAGHSVPDHDLDRAERIIRQTVTDY